MDAAQLDTVVRAWMGPAYDAQCAGASHFGARDRYQIVNMRDGTMTYMGSRVRHGFPSIYRDVMRAGFGLNGSVLVNGADGCDSVAPMPVLRNCRPPSGRTRGRATNGVVWPSLRIQATDSNSSRDSYAKWSRMPAAGVPWHDRVSRAVWRGDWTGFARVGASRPALVAAFGGEHALFDVAFSRTPSRSEAHAACAAIMPAYSAMLDPALYGNRSGCADSLMRLPPSTLTVDEQMRYKMLIVMPGNGAASSIAWAMASGCTLLLPRPVSPQQHGPRPAGSSGAGGRSIDDAVGTPTTWIDALAEPWVHFLPVRLGLSDLQERVTWCIQNDAACAEIGAASRRLLHETYLPRHAGSNAFPSRAAFEKRVRTIQRGVLARIVALARADPACNAEWIVPQLEQASRDQSGTSNDCCTRTTCCELWQPTRPADPSGANCNERLWNVRWTRPFNRSGRSAHICGNNIG